MEPGDDLEVTRRWRVPARELVERFSRSSGPGGQGVNTTDSRVELTFDVTASSSLPEHLRERVLERLAGRLVGGAVVVAASEHRAQRDNRRAARERLLVLLREAAAPPAARRRATRPTRGSQRRRLDTKTRRGEVKRGRQGRWD
ncbi:alternative ribosome rescue aminoacyl-tRNA hydrolase ArfB [Nocardioides zeae]|uniref:Alternative ribosome rescue aminoacyl-tRNA hydrolase ArfB n=1 Tax=Nocardioides imazamoxiresistens TaxID=3231893 RepID=A0ABU3PW95_9ACTN|nr:alternative ribosome rescue aminoacyl-tRNA hydrolase ArfB [Nocardioides zeae]MDT9593512.1 alternative ribosome rescue aminoacyl-tRNA hydrolase ArfB [Nocardioides zeae]